MSNIKKISVGQDSLVSYIEINLNSNGKWTSEYTLDEIKNAITQKKSSNNQKASQ